MSQSPLYWREAATVIFAAESTSDPQGERTEWDSRVGNRRGDIPAQVAQSDHLSTEQSVTLGHDLPCDYKILLSKRSSKSSFMPDKFVFPGGAIDVADFSDAWCYLFHKITNLTPDDLAESVACKGPRPPLITGKRKFILSADVAFRICAIREAFEECGLLVVRNKHQVDFLKPVSANEAKIVSGSKPKPLVKVQTLNIEASDLHEWRNKVHRNAAHFINLCAELQVVPDIWSLVEWSNWLTPAGLREERHTAKPKRFDTIFYLCCMDHVPQVASDMKETVQTVWATPSSLLQQYEKRQINLASPQLFELSRLAIFWSVQSLSQYGNQRAELGLECWCSVKAECTDGVFYLMTGDDLYPEKPDIEGTRDPVLKLNMTVADARKASRKILRCGFTKDEPGTLASNVELKFGQVQGSHFSSKL